MARRIVVTACPKESFCTKPNRGTGAIGITRTIPYRIKSQRLRTRLRPGAVFCEVSLKKPPGEWRVLDGRFQRIEKKISSSKWRTSRHLITSLSDHLDWLARIRRLTGCRHDFHHFVGLFRRANHSRLTIFHALQEIAQLTDKHIFRANIKLIHNSIGVITHGLVETL